MTAPVAAALAGAPPVGAEGAGTGATPAAGEGGGKERVLRADTGEGGAAVAPPLGAAVPGAGEVRPPVLAGEGGTVAPRGNCSAGGRWVCVGLVGLTLGDVTARGG